MRHKILVRKHIYVGFLYYSQDFQDIRDKIFKEEKCKATFRLWVFTLNNYTEDDIARVAKPRSEANHTLNSPIFTHHFYRHAFLHTLQHPLKLPVHFHPPIFTHAFSPTNFHPPIFNHLFPHKKWVKRNSYAMSECIFTHLVDFWFIFWF